MTAHSLNSHSSQAKSLAVSTSRIEAYIDKLFIQKQQEAAVIGDEFKDLVVQAQQFIARGGKRIRPQLVVRSYKAFGGQDSQAIIRVAASQELFHAFALVHDDMIDRDTTRWGGPNISGHYMAKFLPAMEPQNAEHYSSAWALLAGDLYLELAFEALTQSGFTPSRVLKATKLMQQTLFTMVGGELMDVAVSLPGNQTELSQEHFSRMYNAKTAVYSFCTPLRLGALFAGAGRANDKRLNEFGHHLGVAFQIRDDILGVFGDDGETGKSNLSDIREGKRTLLIVYGLEMASSSQKDQLNAILGRSTANRADLKTVKSIIKRSGALERTEALLQSHTDQARDLLLRSDFPMELNNFLMNLLARSSHRTK